MYQKLIILFVLFSLCLGTPLLNALGYSHTNESGPIYFKLHPATYISLVLFLFIILNFKDRIFLVFKYRKPYFLLLCSIVLVIFFLFIFGRSNSIAFIFDTLLAPTLFAISFPLNNSKLRNMLIKVILGFFVLNCSLAILERGLDFNLFPVKGNTEIAGFRASALLGHPLNNALITATIMAFIFLSNNSKKYLLLLLGLISLICFGTRGALYGFGSLTFIFIFYQILFYYKTSAQSLNRNNSQNYRKHLITFLIFAIISTSFIIVYTKLGERLMSVSYFDESSAAARLDVLSILDMYSFSDFIFGVNQKKLEMSLWSIQISIIENFWIQWLFKFGAISFVILVISLLKGLMSSVKYYKNMEKLYLLVMFFIVASTNNSLATSTTALSIFMICSFIFSSHSNTNGIRIKRSIKYSSDKSLIVNY